MTQDMDSIGTISVKIGGVWEEVAEVYQRIAGAWVKLWSVTGPMTVTAPDVYGASASSGTTTTYTAPSTAAVSGGAGPYGYSWAFVSGDSGWSIATPSALSTSFYGNLAAGAAKIGVFRLTVTDANGAIETADCNATIENYGGMGVLA